MKTKLIISLILLIIAVGVVFMVKKPIKETMICLSNIETIEVLIEHMGPSDKPIFPIIFKYSDNAKSDSARLAKVKSERYEVGYVVLMGIDESKQILNIISSRLSLSKPEPEELAEFGTFSFQIYCNDTKKKYIFDKKVSIEILQQIRDFLPTNSKKREVISSLLSRLGYIQ